MEYHPILPDEVIKEILSPALIVPDGAFSSTSYLSPFAKYELSTSTILLVCKSWLRVATPLLYETVVLRSKAQAQALEWTLKCNPQLGGFIRKLRVEGGYGGPMYTIFKSAPRLMDLWLCLVLYSSDSAAGFAKGFRLVNPRRLILFDDAIEGSASRRQLCDALGNSIGDWTNLHTFEFSTAARVNSRMAPRMNKTVQALLGHPNLQYIVITQTYIFPSWLVPFAHKASLQEIRVKSSRPSGIHVISKNEFTTPFENWLNRAEVPKLSEKIVYIPSDADAIPTMLKNATPANVTVSPPLNPNFQPFSQLCDESKESLWRDILYYAGDLPSDEDIIDGHESIFFTRLRQNYRASLLLVSKTFYKAGVPLLYRAPFVRVEHCLKLLARTLKERDYGKYLRMLTVCGYSTSTDLSSILSRTPNLLLVTSSTVKRRPYGGLNGWSDELHLDWAAFVTLAETAGHSLQHFNILLCPNSLNRNFRNSIFVESLGQFKNLRSLVWRGAINVNLADSAFHEGCKNAQDSLPFLESLTYSCAGSFSQPTHFLSLLNELKLPALRRVEFPDYGKVAGAESFLRIHGRKLKFLCMQLYDVSRLFSELCPNLEEFMFNDPVTNSNIDERAFERNGGNSSLTKIVLPYRLAQKNIREYFGFFDRLDLSPFVSLKVLEVEECVWPINQRSIERSPWPAWAERFLEKWNVKLTDGEGKGWTPRLKTITRRR